MNNPEGRTKILVTHALHFLPQVNYICTIADGQVMERGTYAELMADHGVFSKFVKEFVRFVLLLLFRAGAKDGVEVVKKEKNEKRPDTADLKEEYEKGKTIMQEEERNIDAVTWETYKEYLTAGNGYILIPHSPTRPLAGAGYAGHVRLLARVLARTAVPPTRRILRT